MATAEQPTVATADDRAWDLFFEALDSDSNTASRVPPGAAVVAADAPDRDELVRRYHADRRTVVVVYEDGREDILRPRQLERTVLVAGLFLFGVWLALRGGQRVPA
jgi:hypothetical protein